MIGEEESLTAFLFILAKFGKISANFLKRRVKSFDYFRQMGYNYSTRLWDKPLRPCISSDMPNKTRR